MITGGYHFMSGGHFILQEPPVLRTSPRHRKVRELRFRLWGEKLRSLPFARRKSPWGTPPFPTKPADAGLRRGP